MASSDQRRKRLGIGLTAMILLILIAGIGFWLYRIIQMPNVKAADNTTIVLIPTGSSFEDLVAILQKDSLLQGEGGFRKVANWMKFTDNAVKPGRYEIYSGWSNRQLISILRAGIQKPLNVVINNVRTLEELAGKVSSFIEPDSQALLSEMINPNTLSRHGLDKESALTLYIPNSYEFFWNTNANGFVSRMHEEHDRFWRQDSRSEKAQKLDMNEQDVYTLASIVEKETQAASERPAVAGLYLNRLNRGMPLQADPTVVFAVGDFSIRRVLHRHLAIDSPYNTYKVQGLPPGPICMPSISSIDAVLNAEDHNYLYMCARPDNSGLHAFASTLRGHNQNAVRYRNWLNSRGITR